ncbi:MAG TPA: hypothetical protein ENJ79_11705 [Gammaproteobacteria bacterium]|nr:hypothetical protein [Gammaproteobacteria bacterium]
MIMPLTGIENLLKQHIGLHSETVGSGTVRQAVEQRMRACGIGDMQDYARVLALSDTELDALIDAVVIPETWFYRDRHPFDALCAWLREEWLPRHAATPLRMLSVPCSTGEEAYTLAMCLADAGLPPALARVDAVDISPANLDKARRGAYGRNAFRGNKLDFRDRHFTEQDGRYRINDALRHYVHFRRANLLAPDFGQDQAPWHVVFCRNLLIYFDRDTQERAIDRLQSLLVPQGLLFLGHSETGLLLDRPFQPLRRQRCFGFRLGDPEAPEKPQGRRQPPRQAPPGTKTAQNPPGLEEVTRPFANVPVQNTTPVTAPLPAEQPMEGELTRARRLADAGRLEDAARLCRHILDACPSVAEAWYLLGAVRNAAGHAREAEQLLRKAVYLDPLHQPALVLLGVLCEQRGDRTGARRFRARAARAAAPETAGEIS